MRVLFKKLNDNIDKLKIFQQRAKTLSDYEMVQQKLKQFGAALGFAEINLVRKGIKEREDLEAQKLKKFSKRQGQSNIEQEYIKAMSEEAYKNLLEMNQTIRRREIMTKIND